MRKTSNSLLLVVASCQSPDYKTRLATRMKRWEHPELITRKELGEKWPFTTDTVIVHCEKGIYYLVSTTNGYTYGLNGTSKSTGRYMDIEKIWQKDEATGGETRIDIGPILELANRNCGQN